jgi:hypothetical protein
VRYASSKKLCFFVRFASKKRRFFDNPKVLKKAKKSGRGITLRLWRSYKGGSFAKGEAYNSSERGNLKNL